MKCTECNEGRMNAGMEVRHSAGIVVFGSCLRLTGVLVVFAAAMFKLFNVRSFIRPELLEGYPPKDELVSQWLLVAFLLGAALVLLGRNLCRKRKTLTCGNCDRVISGGSDSPLLLRLIPVTLGLAFLAGGGYLLANLVLHLDLPHFAEQSSAKWNERLAAEYDKWVGAQKEGFEEQEGWRRQYRGPVADELEEGGASAVPVLEHIAEHGGSPAAASVLSRIEEKPLEGRGPSRPRRRWRVGLRPVHAGARRRSQPEWCSPPCQIGGFECVSRTANAPRTRVNATGAVHRTDGVSR